MRHLGFNELWINVVNDCFRTSSLSFILNGSPKGLVTPSKRICQGCPLSPYLFLFCTEGFSFLIRQSIAERALHGFVCSQGGLVVSHLFFADDSLGFCKASIADCREIKQLLGCYVVALSQKINMEKSTVTFSPNVHMIYVMLSIWVCPLLLVKINEALSILLGRKYSRSSKVGEVICSLLGARRC